MKITAGKKKKKKFQLEFFSLLWEDTVYVKTKKKKKIIFLILLHKKALLKIQNKQNTPKRRVKEDPNRDDNYWHSTLSLIFRSEHGN